MVILVIFQAANPLEGRLSRAGYAAISGFHNRVTPVMGQAWPELITDWQEKAGRWTRLVRSEWLEGVTNDRD